MSFNHRIEPMPLGTDARCKLCKKPARRLVVADRASGDGKLPVRHTVGHYCIKCANRAMERIYVKKCKCLVSRDVPPEYREAHEARIVKEEKRVQEEMARLRRPGKASGKGDRNQEIIRLYHLGMSQSDLAREFHVRPQRINQIINRKEKT